MKLFSAEPSPFGRKIKLALWVLGMNDGVEIIQTKTADPDSENRKQNPLGKIPTLKTDAGPIYDSRVIIDYLNEKSGQNILIPASGDARAQVQTRSALMNGILDAAILMVYEGRMRPEGMQVQTVLDYQKDKIIRSLTYIQSLKPEYKKGKHPDIGDIGLACVVDYLDLRKVIDWRDYAPSLSGFMMSFSQDVPGYHETLPEGIAPASWRNL